MTIELMAQRIEAGSNHPVSHDIALVSDEVQSELAEKAARRWKSQPN
jgi:hypothetical protein